MERQTMAELEVKPVPLNYNPLQRQRELQRIIQDRRGGAGGGEPAATMGELSERVCQNVFAIQMELAELVERLNWKHWRDYGNENEKSPDEAVLVESRFEAIDILTFLANIFIALGMSWEDVLAMYNTKYNENVRRQREGY